MPTLLTDVQQRSDPRHAPSVDIGVDVGVDVGVGTKELGSSEQRRGILYNLWRFADQRRVVAEEYRRVLACATDELRADALILLGMIGGLQHHEPAFRGLLTDPDARIRELAFKELAGLAAQELAAFKCDIDAGLADPEPRVKRAALKAFRKMPPQVKRTEWGAE